MLGIDAKMYKHFAIVTIALTAGVGVFADGEKREAVAQGVEDVANYQPEKPKGPQLVERNSGATASGSLSGFYGSGGSDYSSHVSVNSGVTPRGLARGRSHANPTPGELAVLGMTMAEFQELSNQQKAAALNRLRDGQTAEQRENAIRAMTSSALARSGGGETSSDY